MSTFKNDCPNGHGTMHLVKKTDTIKYRGMEIPYAEECWQCPVCGLEANTVEQAAAIQEAVLVYQNRMANPVSRILPERNATAGFQAVPVTP